MSCAGHCPTCNGHLGFCSEHTGGHRPCTCPPMGWTCPVCKRGVAPGVKNCDHGAAQPQNQGVRRGFVFTTLM